MLEEKLDGWVQGTAFSSSGAEDQQTLFASSMLNNQGLPEG